MLSFCAGVLVLLLPTTFHSGLDLRGCIYFLQNISAWSLTDPWLDVPGSGNQPLPACTSSGAFCRGLLLEEDHASFVFCWCGVPGVRELALSLQSACGGARGDLVC